MSHYLKKDLIGEGSFGKVYTAIARESGEIVALKQFEGKRKSIHIDLRSSSSGSCSEKIANDPTVEASIMQKLVHPNIVKFIDFLQMGSENFIVMEYSKYGDLLQYLLRKAETGTKGLEETQARQLFSQLISALSFMHDNFYVHLDVKIENLLLFEETDDDPCNLGFRIKLADFGFSQTWSPKEKRVRTVGSLLYCSPEIVLRKATYGPESDIWSAGVVLFAMVFGTLPLKMRGCTAGDEYSRIDKEGLSFPRPISEELIVLLNRIITTNPEKRATIKEILASQWYKGEKCKEVSSNLLKLNLDKISRMIMSPKNSPSSSRSNSPEISPKETPKETPKERVPRIKTPPDRMPRTKTPPENETSQLKPHLAEVGRKNSALDLLKSTFKHVPTKRNTTH